MGEPPTFDWVAPDLAIGGAFAEDQVAMLTREHGVGAVIDLRAEACDDAAELARHGVMFLHLPTPDMAGLSQADLDAGVAFARQVRSGGRRLLIHCQHGIGRSALLALCVMCDTGEPPVAALSRLKDVRERVSPSEHQYLGWADWLARHGRGPVPDWPAYCAIAYRHLSHA